MYIDTFHLFIYFRLKKLSCPIINNNIYDTLLTNLVQVTDSHVTIHQQVFSWDYKLKYIEKNTRQNNLIKTELITNASTSVVQ